MLKNVLIAVYLLLSIMFHCAYSFSYKGEIISEGDSKTDVLSKCGEPSYKETYKEEQKIEKRFSIKNIKQFKKNSTKDSNKEDTNNISFFYIAIPLGEEKTDKHVEEWIYDFGPSNFIQILKFEKDDLAKIETGKYGYEENTLPNPDKTVASKGNTKYDILKTYGNPTITNNSVEEIINDAEEKDLLNGSIDLEDIKDEFSIYTTVKYVNIDEWTYDFGKNRLCKILTFKNNRLTDIKDGLYGNK